MHFHLGQGHSVTTFDLIVITSSIQPRTTGSKQTNTINIYTSVLPPIDILVSLHCGLKLSECGWGGDFAARLGTPGLLPSDPSWASSLPNPTPKHHLLSSSVFCPHFLALLATPWALLEYMYFHKSNSSANMHQIFCYKKWSNSRIMIWAQTFWTRMLPGFCFASL